MMEKYRRIPVIIKARQIENKVKVEMVNGKKHIYNPLEII